MSKLKPKLFHFPKHARDAMICSTLTDNLREQYGRRCARVIKGDTVKVMRGEYSGIEGKVEKLKTMRGTMAIEGVQREKIRGGNVKVQIHASNVKIIAFNLDDKYRQSKLRENLEGVQKTDEQEVGQEKGLKTSSADKKIEKKVE
jgi:large subunit ribosomal protein L24